MTHKHSVYDTDPHFQIDPATRAITNVATAKSKIIQGDHNSERFTFELPRFVDGHDMMLCDKIEVHYINITANGANQSADVYLVSDKQESPEDENVIIFSWLLSGNATLYAGNLSFIIKFKCLTEGALDYVWSTEIFDKMTVSKGIDNGETVIADTSDILEAWKNNIINEAHKGRMITDVISLPTADIDGNRFYRLLTGTFVQNQCRVPTWTCIIVDELPDVGQPVVPTIYGTEVELMPDDVEVVTYYVPESDQVYGFFNLRWYPLETLARNFRLTFNGTIIDILDNPVDDTFSLLLEYKIYSYKDGWTTPDYIGSSGTGPSAEVFNHPSNKATGIASHAEGYITEAKGNYSHAEGYKTKATYRAAHAEGHGTSATADGAHAEGHSTQATQEGAHAEGYGTKAKGYYAHAEGQSTEASGNYSHAEGDACIATGHSSHAGGTSSVAQTKDSFAHGTGVKTAYVEGQAVFGSYNAPVTRALLVVGSGTSDTQRRNAFEVLVNESGENCIKVGNVTITEAQMTRLLTLI